MLNVRYLAVFRTIMQMGTVSGASRILNVSQPALTKSLQLLETRLGVVLFERIKGKLYPTPDAQLLMPEVERLFGMLRSIEHMANEVKHGQVGRIVLAAVPTLAATILPEAVARFRREHPKVAIEILSLSTSVVMQEVSNNQADIGLVDVQFGEDYFETIPLCHAQIGCVVRADNPLAELEFVTPAHLAGQELITFADDTLSGTMIRSAFEECKVSFPRTLIVNQTLVACALVKSLDGVALVDPFPLISAQPGDVKVLPFRPIREIKPCMILPPERPQSVVSDLFLTTLKKTMNDLMSRSSLLRAV
ncbi:LysR family transcriptional regulator [Ensifer soli]|uniref:LysR family transcriptional regulator n=1 Tax=Ciceribacter sp. sgz301302 TaxID=3342379 RepID=UPI0035BADAC9